MFFLHDTNGCVQNFDVVEELKEYIEIRHAEECGFDLISEIKVGKGKYYGCSWMLEIVQIG
ncbi:MAG: hypothetical protein HY279_09405 [Nitrospinae bacterium]|nr:hypothetical protein [Nitrospinota bacterium]